MHPLLLPVLLTAIGAYFLARNIRYLRNQDALRDYVTTSPKAQHWLKLHGEEKTIELTRKYFLPLGVVAALVSLSIGLWTMWQVAPYYLF